MRYLGCKRVGCWGKSGVGCWGKSGVNRICVEVRLMRRASCTLQSSLCSTLPYLVLLHCTSYSVVLSYSLISYLILSHLLFSPSILSYPVLLFHHTIHIIIHPISFDHILSYHIKLNPIFYHIISHHIT